MSGDFFLAGDIAVEIYRENLFERCESVIRESRSERQRCAALQKKAAAINCAARAARDAISRSAWQSGNPMTAAGAVGIGALESGDALRGKRMVEEVVRALRRKGIDASPWSAWAEPEPGLHWPPTIH